MAIDFPNSPANGDTYTTGGKTWVYNSTSQSWAEQKLYTINRALQSNSSGEVAVSAVTATELGYVSGVTSALQTQLNAKQATITGGATTITSSNLTASRALASDASGKVAVSAVTATELGYVSGVTSALQTQLSGKANSTHTHTFTDLTNFTVTTPATGQLLRYNGTVWVNSNTIDGGSA